jgi:hypothetical protein
MIDSFAAVEVLLRLANLAAAEMGLAARVAK